MDLIEFPVNNETFNFFLQGQMIRHPLYNTFAGNLDIELAEDFKKSFKDKEVRDSIKTYKDFHIAIINQKQDFYIKVSCESII